MKFKSGHGKATEKNKPGSSAYDDESQTLCVHCGGCSRVPDGCSPECISCICGAVYDNGTAENIRLESGRDIEITGKAASLICSLARLRRPIIPEPKGRRCASCQRRPGSIIDFAWSSFPDPNFKGATSRLCSEREDGIECTACMQRTYNAVSSAEKEMDTIQKTYLNGLRPSGGVL